MRKRSIPFTIYRGVESIPYYSVFYTDYYLFVEEASMRGDVLIIHDPLHSCRELERSILATRFKKQYNEVIVGIDPGREPYMVVLGDGDILEYRYIDSRRVEYEVLESLKCYPSLKNRIRVGGGYNGWKIVLRLRDFVDKEIGIEVVDEEETSPKQSRSEELKIFEKYWVKISKPYRNKDAYAALKIALRQGIGVE